MPGWIAPAVGLIGSLFGGGDKSNTAPQIPAQQPAPTITGQEGTAGFLGLAPSRIRDVTVAALSTTNTGSDAVAALRAQGEARAANELDRLLKSRPYLEPNNYATLAMVFNPAQSGFDIQAQADTINRGPKLFEQIKTRAETPSAAQNMLTQFQENPDNVRALLPQGVNPYTLQDSLRNQRGAGPNADARMEELYQFAQNRPAAVRPDTGIDITQGRPRPFDRVALPAAASAPTLGPDPTASGFLRNPASRNLNPMGGGNPVGAPLTAQPQTRPPVTTPPLFPPNNAIVPRPQPVAQPPAAVPPVAQPPALVVQPPPATSPVVSPTQTSGTYDPNAFIPVGPGGGLHGPRQSASLRDVASWTPERRRQMGISDERAVELGLPSAAELATKIATGTFSKADILGMMKVGV